MAAERRAAGVMRHLKKLPQRIFFHMLSSIPNLRHLPRQYREIGPVYTDFGPAATVDPRRVRADQAAGGAGATARPNDPSAPKIVRHQPEPGRARSRASDRDCGRPAPSGHCRPAAMVGHPLDIGPGAAKVWTPPTRHRHEAPCRKHWAARPIQRRRHERPEAQSCRPPSGTGCDGHRHCRAARQVVGAAIGRPSVP